MTNLMREPGVLIVRDDGVIVVPDAEPWPAALADAVEQLLDKLGATKRQEPHETGD
jgi:hypothetical protein